MAKPSSLAASPASPSPFIARGIVQAATAGVPPRNGIAHVTVGLGPELQAIHQRLAHTAEGGSSALLLVGPYGSGKTHAQHIISEMARRERIVTMTADLAPDRRLSAGKGKPSNLLRALAASLATPGQPGGAALRDLLDLVVEQLDERAASRKDAETVLREFAQPLLTHSLGYELLKVLRIYWSAAEEGQPERQEAVLRWLGGGYETIQEAKAELGQRVTLLCDDNWYDYLQILARLAVLAGFGGLVVFIDELVNLYKLADSRIRQANYERILQILNDCMGGRVPGLMAVFSGTPEALTDPRRGLYSYEALRSRLSENPLAVGGLVDFSGPVIRLRRLGEEEKLVLLQRYASVHQATTGTGANVPAEAMEAFLGAMREELGHEYAGRTRDVVRRWAGFLAILAQNADTTWQEVLGQLEPEQTGQDADDLEFLSA